MSFNFTHRSFRDLVSEYNDGALTIPPHQREYVWGTKQNFIDELIFDILCGKFYGILFLNDVKGTESQKTPIHESEIEDGQQRFLTGYKFIVDQVHVSKKYSKMIYDMYRKDYLEEINNTNTSSERSKKLRKIVEAFDSGKAPNMFYFSDLPKTAQRQFERHTVVTHEQVLTVEEKIRWFLRLQNHMPLQYGDFIHTLGDPSGGNDFAQKVCSLFSISSNSKDPLSNITKLNNMKRDMNLFAANVIQCLLDSRRLQVYYGRAGLFIVNGVMDNGNDIPKDKNFNKIFKNLKDALIDLYSLNNSGTLTLSKTERYSKTFFKMLLALVALKWDDTQLTKYINDVGLESFVYSTKDIFETAKNYKTKLNSAEGFEKSQVVDWSDYYNIMELIAGQHSKTEIEKFANSVLKLLQQNYTSGTKLKFIDNHTVGKRGE